MQGMRTHLLAGACVGLLATFGLAAQGGQVAAGGAAVLLLYAGLTGGVSRTPATA